MTFCTCTLTTSRGGLNIKVIGLRSKSPKIFCVFLCEWYLQAARVSLVCGESTTIFFPYLLPYLNVYKRFLNFNKNKKCILTITIDYQVRRPSLDTVCDSGILRAPSVDRCNCSTVEMRADELGRTLHKALLVGRDSLCQGVDPCETTGPSTRATASTNSNILTQPKNSTIVHYSSYWYRHLITQHVCN